MPESPATGDNLTDLWRKLVNNQVESGATHAARSGDNWLDLKRKFLLNQEEIGGP